jgi:hypothetical protein
MTSQFFLSQMNHWAFFPVLLLCMGVAGEERSITVPWGFFGLFPFLLVLIRRKVNRFLPFMGLHLLTGVLFWWILPWGGVSAVILRGGIILYLMMSFVMRVKEGDRLSPPLPPPVAVGIAAFALMVQPFIAAKPAEDISFTLSIAIYFFSYFIWSYLEHYLYFLKVNSSSTGYLPAGEIFRSGAKTAGIYAAFGALLLLLTGGINWLSNLLKPLGHMLILFLRFLFSLIGEGEELEEIEEKPRLETDFLVDTGSGEPSIFWEVLGQIFLWVLLIVSAVFLIKGLIRLIRMLYQRFLSRLTPEQVVGDDGVRDIREKCDTEKQTYESIGWWTALRPGERIRRWYKKLLIQGNKKLPQDPKPEIHTTKDWGRLLQLSGFTDIYEKARYGEQECTMEDVKLWKETAKRSNTLN